MTESEPTESGDHLSHDAPPLAVAPLWHVYGRGTGRSLKRLNARETWQPSPLDVAPEPEPPHPLAPGFATEDEYGRRAISLQPDADNHEQVVATLRGVNCRIL